MSVTVLAGVKPAPDGHRSSLWRQLRSRLAASAPGQPQHASWARSPTTIRPTGGRLGRCSPARSPTSGMPAGTPARSSNRSKPPASACRAQIIWAKDRFAFSRGHYHWQHEPCWYAVRGTFGALERRSQAIDAYGRLMPARKIRASATARKSRSSACSRPIENNSSPGQAVYDPFCGSGTTIIAAEMTGRSCFAIEIDPALCRCCGATLAGVHGRDRHARVRMAQRSRITAERRPEKHLPDGPPRTPARSRAASPGRSHGRLWHS